MLSEKSERKVSVKVFVLALMVVSLLTAGMSVVVFSGSGTVTIEPGSFTETVDYVVWVSGGTFYSKNGQTGAVTSSADSDALIQSAVDAVSSAGGGSVHVKSGSYSATTTLKDGVTLTLDRGVSGVTVSIDSGASATLIDLENSVTKVWSSGTLIYHIDSGNLLASQTLNSTEYWVGSDNRTDVLANPKQTASYIIYTDGTNIYAKNGTTGEVEFSGTDASTVIQSALNALNDPVSGGGTIFLADVKWNSSLTIPDNVLVIEQLGASTKRFINSSGSQGSPYTISTDGTNYYAQDKALNYINNWTSTNGSSVVQTVFDSIPVDGGKVIINGNIECSDPLTISKPIILQGLGQGIAWTDDDIHASSLVWTGTTNDTPFITILGTTDISELKDIPLTIEQLAIIYDSSSTGTDGIYLDGDNSYPRGIIIRDVIVLYFTGYGIHAVGSTFDIKYYNIAVRSCESGAVKIEDSTGVASQHYFFNPTLWSSAANTYALYTEASTTNIYGGTISNHGDGNGLYYYECSGLISGTNIEGANVEDTVGLTFVGAGLVVEGGIITGWDTGVQLGINSGLAARGYYINPQFGSNTLDVNVTSGGSRQGVFGTIADRTISTFSNYRRTSDGVHDVIRLKEGGQSWVNITVTSSPFLYRNTLDASIEVYVYGGTVSAIEYQTDGVTIDTDATQGIFPLMIGDYLKVTYSSAPTMKYRFIP